MLIKCPECDLQVSDRAFACPHCGYPLKEQLRPVKKSTRKRRRLPNGFGQISEIKGQNLRKPFRAMVTVGKTPKGKPICKLLKPEAFFETYNDAYAALVEYNRNPFDLDTSMTMAELFEKWKEDYVKSGKKERSLQAMTYAWDYCAPLHSMRVKDIRSRHIQGCIENGEAIVNGIKKEASPGTKNRMKSLLNLIMDYAVQYEITDKNYARIYKLPISIQRELRQAEKHHIPFSDEEINEIWKHASQIECSDMVLIQCYSGWRPMELCTIKLKDVDLENWTFTGGMKTEAGTNRVVPIHSRIREFVKKRYDEAVAIESDVLFNHENRYGVYVPFSYNQYKQAFDSLKEKLDLDPRHKPHDCRAHFITTAKNVGMDEYAIKHIVGHLISDVTERVYTQRPIEWLRDEIEKIK